MMQSTKSSTTISIIMNFWLPTDSVYKPVINPEKHQNDRDEEEGGASQPSVSEAIVIRDDINDILLENIQELKREFQETTQDFSNRIEQHVRQVNELRRKHQPRWYKFISTWTWTSGSSRNITMIIRKWKLHKSENVSEQQNQENNQSNCYYYRELSTTVYISFVCWLSFAISSTMFKNRTFDLLVWAFMVMSVLTLFGSTYKKRDWMYLFGWLTNMIGALCIFIPIIAIDQSNSENDRYKHLVYYGHKIYFTIHNSQALPMTYLSLLVCLY